MRYTESGPLKSYLAFPFTKKELPPTRWRDRPGASGMNQPTRNRPSLIFDGRATDRSFRRLCSWSNPRLSGIIRIGKLKRSQVGSGRSLPKFERTICNALLCLISAHAADELAIGRPQIVRGLEQCSPVRRAEPDVTTPSHHLPAYSPSSAEASSPGPSRARRRSSSLGISRRFP